MKNNKQRELKLRFWDKKKRVIVYDMQNYVWGLRGKKSPPSEKGLYIQNSKVYGGQDNGYDGFDLLDLTHRFVVMQYTGLKDKNGKDIYEHDILRAIYPGCAKCGHGTRTEVSVVFFVSGCFRLYDHCSIEVDGSVYKGVAVYPTELAEPENVGDCGFSFYSEVYTVDHEVIGNIYENPELLKK